MDLVSLLSIVILVTTIGTMAVGVAAYIAFKLRDKRKPRKGRDNAGSAALQEPIFLKPYLPGGVAASATDSSPAAAP